MEKSLYWVINSEKKKKQKQKTSDQETTRKLKDEAVEAEETNNEFTIWENCNFFEGLIGKVSGFWFLWLDVIL